jgi:hypothetical protein
LHWQAKLEQSIQQFAGIFYVSAGILAVGLICLVLVSHGLSFGHFH